MDGESKWFVPRNTDGGYNLAIEIVQSGKECYVFVRSGLKVYDRGDIRDLESLMEVADIRYITGRKPAPLPFDVAVEFMKKQTALKMV